MKKLISEFYPTGICRLNVVNVVKAWSNKFSISQFHDEYKFVKTGRGGNYQTVAISKVQADYLIEVLKLLPIQCTLFKNGKTYKTESFILSEIDRIQELQKETQTKLAVINSTIDELKNALSAKC